MFRRTCLLVVLMVATALCANRADAIVFIFPVKSGQAPSVCPAALVPAVKKLKLVHGIQLDGFGGVNAHLYGRGTQEDIQSLLNSIGESELSVTVNVDESGKAGLLKANENVGPKRAMWYVYCLSFHKQHLRKENVKPKLGINLTVFTAAGIKPDQLKIPSNVTPVAKRTTEKVYVVPVGIE